MIGLHPAQTALPQMIIDRLRLITGYILIMY